MNELKNYHCLSKARYRGLDNVQIQAYMAAIAINIKRLVNFLLYQLYYILWTKLDHLLQQAGSFYENKS